VEENAFLRLLWCLDVSSNFLVGSPDRNGGANGRRHTEPRGNGPLVTKHIDICSFYQAVSLHILNITSCFDTLFVKARSRCIEALHGEILSLSLCLATSV
jgi:hypothetical protein